MRLRRKKQRQHLVSGVAAKPEKFVQNLGKTTGVDCMIKINTYILLVRTFRLQRRKVPGDQQSLGHVAWRRT